MDTRFSVAAIEGWDLFEIAPNKWRIQRDDDENLWPSDEAAVEYVEKWADKGSPIHCYALSKHRFT